MILRCIPSGSFILDIFELYPTGPPPFLKFYLLEQAVWVGGQGGTELEGEGGGKNLRISSTLCAEYRAGHWARSHNPEVMT